MAAAAALGVALVGCGGQGTGAQTEGKSKTTSDVESTSTKVLWVGDSIAGAEGPALGAALKASGVEFKDASSDGGGTVVAGSEEITKMIAADTWKQLAQSVKSFRPTVIAYQITTYDWGTQDQQRAAYEKLVKTAKAAGAKTVFVPAPPIKIDDFYKKYASQMRTAPQVVDEVAKNSGGAAAFLDASQLWGTDASAKKAQRASDGIHNCQQGAAAFAAWFTKELGKKEGFTPAAVDAWAKGSWTSNDRYAKLKCDS
ncbi:SGNH/GDSL hydrolase family protein [Streptomyces sp. NPDC059152]|uniref:SGNH/GDSL hydrolase family protein n=1 Tax=Streptomyces sp. NPDC059152 TaxID=3346742 RepID=UPI00368B487B